MFLVHPAGRFVPTVTIVTFWLLIRSIVLFVASRLVGGSVRLWITLSAATDTERSPAGETTTRRVSRMISSVGRIL